MGDTQSTMQTWAIDTGDCDRRYQILAIPGSLRRQSYNRRLLEAALRLAPAGVEMKIIDLTEIPHYNLDVEERGDPEPVVLLKEQIRRADALLIATPEYNGSIPGVLKGCTRLGFPPADPECAPGQAGRNHQRGSGKIRSGTRSTRAPADSRSCRSPGTDGTGNAGTACRRSI